MAQCLYPIVVPKYKNVTIRGYPVKTIVGRIGVPCGKCLNCRRRKQNEWAYRCMAEVQYSETTAFICLTYDDHHLVSSPLGIPTLVPRHLTQFVKNLRYRLPKLRFFACGEYGDVFSRPHYHLLLFLKDKVDHDEVKNAVKLCWKHGNIDYQPDVTAGNAKYCAKYSMKRIGFDYGDVVPPFARMSRRPGIGADFIDDLPVDNLRKFDQWILHDYQGTPYPIPRYYKPHIWSQQECDVHNLLLDRLRGNLDLVEDFYFDSSNGANRFKTELNIIQSVENRFSKSLRVEMYPFSKKKVEPSVAPWYRPYQLDDLHCDETFLNFDYESNRQKILESSGLDGWNENVDF